MRAWSRSLKLSALMVVNSIDRVSPLRKSTAAMTAADVAAVSKPQAKIVAIASTPCQIKVRRNPNRPSTVFVAGFMPRLPANTASSSRPESSGLSPNASWNISGNRNGTALMAARNSTPPLTVTASSAPETA
jgi:hypothetical protein